MSLHSLGESSIVTARMQPIKNNKILIDDNKLFTDENKIFTDEN
jgi:hypothetical protein